MVRALQAVDRSDIALLVIDGTVGITAQDQRLAERIDGAGCPVVVVINKWELLDADERDAVRYQIGQKLHFVGEAPVLTVSALTGKGVHRLLPALGATIDAYHRRVPTRRVNEVVRAAQSRHPAPDGARILYATQGAADPPTFTLFTNRELPRTYLRFIENQLREAFDLGRHPDPHPGPPPDLVTPTVERDMEKPILAVVAVGCGIAALVWGRSARYLRKVELRLEQETGADSDATALARAQFRKELHTALLYLIVGLASLAVSFSDRGEADVLYAFVLVPVAIAILYGRDFIREARLFEDRANIERRAEEVLSQEDLAPRRWAERLAPEHLPAGRGLRHRQHLHARHRSAGRRLLRPVRRRPDPPGRRHRRRDRSRHRAVDHGVPGQGAAAGLPRRVPRPGAGAGGPQPADVAARPARGVRLDPRRRVRPRTPARCATRRPGTPSVGCGTTATSCPCGRPARCSCSTPTATLPQPGAALRRRRPAAAVHRRPRRGPRRPGPVRRGAHRPVHPARSRAWTSTSSASRWSRRPATSRRRRSPTTSPSSRSGGPDVAMEDIAAAAERALQGNLHKEAAKLERQGKLFVRDRLALLLDEGSFVEDALLANARRPWPATTSPPTASSPASGRIEGRPGLRHGQRPDGQGGLVGGPHGREDRAATEYALSTSCRCSGSSTPPAPGSPTR